VTGSGETPELRFDPREATSLVAITLQSDRRHSAREQTATADSIRMKAFILSGFAIVALIGFAGCATGASVSTADHTVSTSTGIY
jgi:hypothetical protein